MRSQHQSRRVEVSLGKRMRALVYGGHLTQADLAAWLGRSHASLRNWVELVNEPRPFVATDVASKLAYLERAVQQRTGFPLPIMSMRLQKAYIMQVRDHVINGGPLPKLDPAGRRLVHRLDEGATG